MKLLKIIIILVLWFSIIWVLFYQFWFLRNPERIKINDNSKFLSPANGKIVQILERDTESIPVIKKHYKAFNTFTNDVADSGYLISIMMTPLDVHYQRAPLDAKLINQTHTKWKFLNAIKIDQLNDVVFENERNEMLWETNKWMKYKVIQIAGKLAKRIIPMKEIGKEVTQWDTIGLIKLWSQVTIILPKDNVEITTKVWDVVIDGETILANVK